MNQTHVAAGVSLAAGVAVLVPESAPWVAAAGAVGGSLPDLDLLAGRHRRTLHFPAGYWLAAAPVAAVAILTGSLVAVWTATLLAAAGVHAAGDALGAGNELRPWERTSDEAVYLHVAGRWLRPRYVVRYDGAPEDVLAAALAAVPALVTFDGAGRWALVAVLGSGLLYALVRKRTVRYAERFVD